MFHKILDEAMRELKDDEFKDVLEAVDGKAPPPMLKVTATVEPDFDARLPENYVSNVAERINLYTRLSELDNEEELDKFTLQLVDRFGEMPKSVSNLVLSVRFKIAAQNLFAEKVKTKEDAVHLFFNNDLGEQFYRAKTFTTILAKVNTHPSHFSFKQGKNHLILAISGFTSYRETLEQIKLLGQ